MADVIKKATNKFTKGLVMDFSPENTQNEVLTHALNATLLTFNGNELSLQNDMGNARVETAFLPEGYMPVGTCEYGGIVYIVSYNPLEDKSQIGCFPSPERNISREELGNDSNITIENSDFQDLVSGSFDGNLSNTTKYVILRNDNLNPGDKFLISSGDSIYQECLEGLKKTQDGVTGLVEHPVIALNVVSIEESGKIVYLNSDLRQYSVAKGDNTTYSYHVLGTKEGGVTNIKSEDLDAYRTTLSSGYNVFRSKTSGKLAILAELITIDSYSVTHSIQPRRDEDGEIIDGYFDVVIHTEVSPEVTEQNYTTVPKLKYYYLDKSQGFIQTGDGKYTLFDNNELNDKFLNLNLQQLYVPTVEGSIDFNYTLGNVGEFNFPKPKTYHGHVSTISLSQFDSVSGYSKFEEGKFHRVHSSQIIDNLSYYERTLNARFYRYQSTDAEYKEYNEDTINEAYTYYVQTTAYTYEDAKRNEVTYKGKTLYKVSIEPEIAKEEQIVDKEVEKFQSITVETFIKATDDDYESGKDLWKKEGETYSEVATKPDDFYISDGKYFTKEVKKVLVPVGFEVENANETYYYYPKNKQVYIEATSSDLADYWNFDKYELTENPPYGCPIVLYARNEEIVYRRATADEIYNNKGLGVQLYYKAEYVNIFASEVENFEYVYVVIPMDVYIPKDTFTPNSDYNYISGEEAPDDEIPAGDPITLYDVNDFIPSPEEDYAYNDLKLGNIKIPNVVSVNGLDLPFKYDYTIVPCMNYGKLPHLAVSNTVDFSKLHAFNQSNFNIWKYRIDGNQLRLTFGTEVFDTYENNKVDAVILEFYDLWGFAGSLEITNKKSYTGTFTKILDLNALNSLSTKKISGGGYTYNYARNINIQEAVHGDPDGGFKFGGKEIVFTGHDSGWRYADGTELGDNNDCGALYSNIVYGVKTYFRRPDGEIYEFIRKDDFFMFTLPIYNDYYYTVDNYNTLENPQLEMFLTYKIVDNGTKVPLNYDNIVNGYCHSDKTLVDEYIAGNNKNEGSDLNVIRYYKFKGTSDVNLEVGLKQEYSNFNLMYDPSINSIFTCKLQLISDDSVDRPFTVKFNNNISTDYEKDLNYKNSDNVNLPIETLNKIGFDSSFTQAVNVDQNFEIYNFLTKDSTATIPINYEFTVGYKINISNIRKTKIPATTVCALCHKNNGEYNYKDFSIYEHIDDDGNSHFYSDAIYYNDGDSSTVKFGLAKQVSDNKNLDLSGVCKKYLFEEDSASIIKNSGVFNTAYLDKVLPKIGKLAFCAPHAHAIDDENTCNIHVYNNKYMVVDSAVTNKVNRFNMVAHTNLMFSQKSEFYSVINGSDYIITIPIFGDTNKRYYEFSSVSASGLETFNRRLLENMKQLYAYNPDYDYLDSYAGDVNVLEEQIQFTSNLISSDASLNFSNGKSLNDYIFIGPIKIKNYFQYLYTYSGDNLTNIGITSQEGTVKPQLQFIPNYTFCGGSKEPYLISNITYNTPTPSDLGSSLEHTSSSSVIVKHHDETATILSGDLDKKDLYFFDKNTNKLVSASSFLLRRNSSSSDSISISDRASCGQGELAEWSTTGMWDKLLNNNYTCNVDIESHMNTVIPKETIRVNIGMTIDSKNLWSFTDGDSLFIAFKPYYADSWYFGQERPLYNTFKMKLNYSTVSNNKPLVYSFDDQCLALKARMSFLSDIFCMPSERNNPESSDKYDISDISKTTLINYILSNDKSSTGMIKLCNISGEEVFVSRRNMYHPSYGTEYGNLEICGKKSGGNMGGSWDSYSSYAVTNAFNSNGVCQTGEIPISVGNINKDEYFPICLIQINVQQITALVDRMYNYKLLDGDIVYPPKNQNYAYISGDGSYDILGSDTYRFPGTTIVIEDLSYEPNSEHRLYMKKTGYSQTGTTIIHRGNSDKENTEYKNAVFLFSGPSFEVNYFGLG